MTLIYLVGFREFSRFKEFSKFPEFDNFNQFSRFPEFSRFRVFNRFRDRRKFRVKGTSDINIPLELLSEREEDLNKFRAQPLSTGPPVQATQPPQILTSGSQNLQFSLDTDSGSEIEINDPVSPGCSTGSGTAGSSGPPVQATQPPQILTSGSQNLQFSLDTDSGSEIEINDPVSPGCSTGSGTAGSSGTSDINIPLELLSDREEDLNKFRAQPLSTGPPVQATQPPQILTSGSQNLQFSLDTDSGSEIEINDPVSPGCSTGSGTAGSSGPPVQATQPPQILTSGSQNLQFSLDTDSGSEIEINDPVSPGPIKGVQQIQGVQQVPGPQEVQVGVRRKRVKGTSDINIPLDLLSDREEDLNKFRAQPLSAGAPLQAAAPSHRRVSGTQTLEFSLDAGPGDTFNLSTAMPPTTRVFQGAQPVVQGRAPAGPTPVNFDEFNIAPILAGKPLEFNLESEGSDLELAPKSVSRPNEIPLDSDKEDHGTPVELDLNITNSSNEFEYIKSGASGIFIAKDGFYFNSVRENKVVFFDGKNAEFAMKVVRDGIGRFKALNNVFIYFDNGAVREFNKVSGTWNEKPVRMEVDESGRPLHVRVKPAKNVPVVDGGDIVLQDSKAEAPLQPEDEEIDDGEYADISGVELNLSNKYSTTSYTCEKEFLITTFTANEGFGFRAVWFNKDRSTGIAIWTAASHSQYSNKVVYHNYAYINMADVMVHLFNGKRILFATNGDSWKQFDVNKLNPVIVNIDALYDSYSYYKDPEGSCAVITAKEPFIISHLVEFHGITNKLRDVWRANSPDDYLVKVVVDNMLMYVDARNINLYYKDGRVRFLTRIKGTNWTDRSNKVELDIGRLHDSIAYSFFKDGLSATYERRNDFLITRVKLCKGLGSFKSTIIIWTPRNPGEYVKRVIIDGFSNPVASPQNAIIFLDNGTTKHMNFLNYRWIEIEPSCVLDISRKETTYEYTYSKDERKIETFTPRYHFLFKGVKCSVGSGSSRVQVDIWEAKDPREYAHKVCLVPSGKKERFLVIFQDSGEFKVFNKYDKNRPWTDHSKNRYSINDIRLSGLDIIGYKMERERLKLEQAERLRAADSSAGAFQPFDPSQYKPAHTILERLRYSKPQPQGLLQPSPSQEFQPARVPVEDEGKNLLYLDINKRHNIFGYTISYRGDKVIFKAFEPFLFGIVKSEGTTLWRYKGDEYPNRVLYKEVDGKPKVKVYFPDYRPPVPFVLHGPRTKFDPSTIQVEVSKCKKPGHTSESDLYKATVVEVSGKPVSIPIEDPDDLFVPPSLPRQSSRVFDLDD
nr:hypothetical protein MACL_00002171 [Theileria orientalis]